MNDSISDPAPHPLAIHTERLVELTSNITSTSLEGIRRIREKCDEVMRQVQERDLAVQREIAAFSDSARASIAAGKIMEEALDKLIQELKVQPPPSVKPTDKPTLVDKDKAAVIDRAIEERKRHFPALTAHFGPERPLGKSQ